MLIDKLGQGGYGAVYLARDTVAEINVALKALPRQVTHNKDELDDIRQNFSLVSRLHHQNIANLLHLHEIRMIDETVRLEFGVAPGNFLTVMEYVKGKTLRSYQKNYPDRRLPVEEAMDICMIVAEALDYAHSKKIIHRDIKSSNIMLTTDKEVKILDFGIAAEIRSSLSRVTGDSSDICGTYRYMSPEQWLGRRQDARTDQYALAVLLYELINGDVPFASIFMTNDSRLMRETVMNQDPEPLQMLSKKQNKALLRAFSKTANDRFDSCLEFMSTLSGTTTTTGLTSTIRVPDPHPNRRLMLAVLGIVSIVVLAAYGIHRHAENERLATETELRINRVGPIRRQAKIQWETTSNLTSVQIFADRLEEVRLNMVLADTLFDQAEYTRALETYQDVINQCLRLHTAVEEHDDAIAVRAACETQRDEAAKADHADPTADIWLEADAFRQAAERTFKAGNYNEAEHLWATARDQFVKIGDTPARPVPPAPDPAPKATATPVTLTITATADGREVSGAVVTVDGAVQSGGTPLAIEAVIGSEYEIVVEYAPEGMKPYKRYHTTYKADGAGPHTLHAMLTVIDGPQLSQPWKIADMDMEFAAIPPGSFLRGSDHGEANEQPVHEVVLTKPFWMGVFEVTQTQYKHLTSKNPSHFAHPYNPVERVSWYDATDFCRRLTAREARKAMLPENYVYRLPTEAEWEYGCRAGTSTPFAIGNNLDSTQANFDGSYPYGTGKRGVNRRSTITVGSFRPNTWNIHDMHGNISEWCLDWYSDYMPNLQVDPVGPATGANRVIRGGSWNLTANDCRSALRIGNSPSYAHNFVGFRIVLGPRQETPR